MNRSKLLLFVLSLAGMMIFAACKKDKEEGEGKDETAETAEEGAETAAKGAEGEGKAEEAEAEAEEAEGEEAAAGDISKEEAAEKAVAMMQSMADAVEANAEDCDAMGDALQKIVDENKEFMEQTKHFEDDPETKKWFDENYGPKMMEIMGGMMENLQKCAENEKVKAAMESLE